METIWKKRNKNINKQEIIDLSNKTGYSEFLSELFLSRNLDSKDQIDLFISENDLTLFENYNVKSLKKASDLIIEIMEREEKIDIYGDYDCDGTIGTFILYDYLTILGANVEYYIPNRLTEGYGLNSKAIDQLYREGAKLIITVDNGITSISEAEQIKDRNIKFIITDHHEPLSELPEADVIVNFKLEEYPELKSICGACTSLALIYELNKYFNQPKTLLDEYSELVCISTIADLVELNGFNRKLVRQVFNRVNKKGFINPGLKELTKLAEVKDINTGVVGFRIAPMINAAGRLGDADKVIELLGNPNSNIIKRRAEELYNLNHQRTQIEDRILKEALDIVKNKKLYENDIIIVSNENWHKGVIGIVASRIQDVWNKPVIVISTEEEIGHASCRSIPGFNLFEALDSIGELFEKYGGHEQAAGFSIKKENIEKIYPEIKKYTETTNLKELFKKSYYYDSELNEDIDLKTVDIIESFQPCGIGNPEPIIKIENKKADSIKYVGKDKKHLKFKCDGIECIFFNGGEFKEIIENFTISFLSKIKLNCYNGPHIQFNVVDFKVNPFNDFKSAENIIQNSQNPQEWFNLTKEFGPLKLLPRDFLVKVYKLAKKARERGFYVSQFVKKSNFNQFDLAIALNILSDAGLLTYNYNNDILTFKIFEKNNKINLEETKTFQKLLKAIDQNKSKGV